jgi:hypothetical protein
MMKLPAKKKTGNLILASDWNMLLDALAAVAPRLGTGTIQPPLGQLPKGQPPFSVIAIETSGVSYLVTIKEGWVIERQPMSESSPAVLFHMPKYGATTLSTIPRPQLTMAVNDIAWCRYKTGPSGLVNAVPEIVIAAANQDGAHYYPDDPEGSGQDGDFYVKLFKLVMDGTAPAIIIYQQSDIEHTAQLWTGENVGTGIGVFKEHDEAGNIYKFRTIKGDGVTLSGDGTEILIGANGAHLDLKIVNRNFILGTDDVVIQTGYSFGYKYRWRHGHYIGRYAYDAVPLDGDDVLTIHEQIVTFWNYAP